MKFPKRIKHRNKVLATIYGKSRNYPRYRLAYYVAGRRRLRTFATYSKAKASAEKIVRDLAQGSQVTALTAPQARDALAASERLQDLFRATGRKVSLLAAVSEFVDISLKLDGQRPAEAVEGYLRTVVNVRRKQVKEAVDEFLKANEPLTRATDGQRAQLSAKYTYNRKIQLLRFAAAFPGTDVCDLTKEHLNKFIGSLDEFSPKSRNHYRAAIHQWLQWAVRKDYLPISHRLAEADRLQPERANTAEIEFYTAKEFGSLLKAAERPMQTLMAIGGLAGLRTAELLRLDWADVWRVPGHIEITAGKSKTRARRLVEICPSLAAWLKTSRKHKKGKLWEWHEITFHEHFGVACKDAEVTRKDNGLRHAFCTYHFALHANENLTAMQAGNSPAMIHAHYKGLATKLEAEEWFAVMPAKT